MNSSIHRDEERRGITKKEENKSAIEVIESEDEDVDKTGSGKIDFNEFLELMTAKMVILDKSPCTL